jgi:hypothetical protein
MSPEQPNLSDPDQEPILESPALGMKSESLRNTEPAPGERGDYTADRAGFACDFLAS